MPEPGASVAPRELVVASAGSGKTYRLSRRILELLDGGAAPEEIFASTFTRKAAGEILDRVLLRLAEGALNPEGARDPDLGRARCAELLAALVDRLYALNVGTLDSFFQRVSRAFTLELGLPARWTLSDGPAEARLRSEAVSRLLEEANRGTAVELVRLLHGGAARRRVHDLLLEQVADLHGLFQELDPGVDHPWGFAPGDLEQGGPVALEELHSAARAIAEAEVPLTTAGEPNRNWVKARADAAEYVAEGDFDGFLGKGLGAKMLDGDPRYYGKPMPDSMAAALEGALALARRELGRSLEQRADALGRLLPLYDRWIRRLRREAGLYQFDDVTRILARGGAGARGDELHYRLDARIRHILLDEFQDTSLVQWWAIRPLVAEILSGTEEERGMVIVADPKQSIYGWRGGEPRLLEAIERDFTIPRTALHESWRSAPVVLEFVNRVFASLSGSGVLDDTDRGTAAAWLENFQPHESAGPLRDLPGHVRVEVGPGEEGSRGSVRPRLLAGAAERVAELHRECPPATIGVLTRTNRAVARLMGELRRLDVDASEEGGVPVADSPAVLSVLALLRMADHPGDRAARYQVAHTPVRDLVSDLDWTDTASAGRVAARVRRRLARSGYGPVVAGWVRTLEARGNPRDRRRLRQLAELAFRWDERASLRPGDFVRWVEDERMEDPAAARIRVMTVHQAKGLQFDIVVLPDLDQPLAGGRGEAVYPYRPRPDAPVTRIYPGMREDLVKLFPSVAPAAGQAREARVRDGLSALYVALTRARFAVHVLVKPDPKSGPSSAVSGARLVREALGRTERIEEGDLLWEGGGSRWWTLPAAPEAFRRAEATLEVGGRRAEDEPAELERLGVGGPGPLLDSRPAGSRRRLLARRSPSELEGGGTIRLERMLRDRGRAARDEGTVIHAWLERVEWLDDGMPAEEELRHVARRVAPGLEGVDELLARLRRWLEAPEVRAVLDREAYPEGSRVARERPFLVREGDALVQGVVDRIVTTPDARGHPGRAWILDYKTDRVAVPDGEPPDSDVLARRVEFYRPQMEAYRRAVARDEGLASERVEAALVFLRMGRVVRL